MISSWLCIFGFHFSSGLLLDEVYGQVKPDTVLASRYFSKAGEFAKAAQHDSARFYFEHAGVIYEAAALQRVDPSLWEKLVQCYNELGVVLRKQGEYDQALDYLNKALGIGTRKLVHQSLTVASTHHGLGVVYRFQGEMNQALEHFHQSLQIKLAILGDTHSSVGVSYNSLGNAYRAKGDYDQALEYYQKSLKIGLQIWGDEHASVAAFYNNIGVVYYDKGDYEKALEYFHKVIAIELRTLGENDPEMASSYNNLGNIHHDNGDFDQALEYHRKALELRQRTVGERHIDVAESHFNLGRVYHDLGQYDRALQHHQQALTLELETFGERHFLVAESYLHIAKARLASPGRKNYDTALAYYDKALRLQLQTLGKQHPEVALTYQEIGKAHEQQNDIPGALAYYQKSMTTLVPAFRSDDVFTNPGLQEASNKLYLLHSLSLKAGALAKLSSLSPDAAARNKSLEFSLSTCALASQLLDKLRASFAAEGSKLFLVRQFGNIYHQAVQSASQLYIFTGREQYRQQAFSFMEKNKAAVLHEALQESQAKRFAAIPDSLLQKERELRVDRAYYETEIGREAERPEAERDQSRINRFHDHSFALNREYEQLLTRFENEFPRYYQLKHQTQVSGIADVQKMLDDNSALIEYLVGDSVLHVAAVTRKTFAFHSQPLDSAFVATVTLFQRALKFVDKEDYLHAGARLYEILLQPVEAAIAGKDRLIVIPDGGLHYLPFEALLSRRSATDDFRKMDYLIRKYEISYHYSATLWHWRDTSIPFNSPAANLQTSAVRADANRQPLSDFIGFAPVFEDEPAGRFPALAEFIGSLFRSVTVDGKRYNALPNSEKEVQAIANLFENGRRIGRGYFHGEATEENFKARAGVFRFVHVATHGILHEDSPELSGLIFAQPKDSSAAEDGILFAAETYNLALHADLVVLSSCESGLGKLVKGEGLMALTRGFLYSGANNVIHSLWKVGDKHASQMMIELYRNVLAGRRYSQALRQAKLKLIANEVTAFPASWSSFVLVGQ